jgi:hypothetical protein
MDDNGKLKQPMYVSTDGRRARKKDGKNCLMSRFLSIVQDTWSPRLQRYSIRRRFPEVINPDPPHIL